MDIELVEGRLYRLEQPMTPGAGKFPGLGGPTRVVYRTGVVEYLGRVPFEPNLIRVRAGDGSVFRTDRANLRCM